MAREDIDQLLIRELVKDGRVPYTKLSRTAGLAYTSVRERLERLINRGYLDIKPLISPKIYGEVAAVVRFRCRDSSRIINILSRCNRVLAVVKLYNRIEAVIVGRSKTEITAVIERIIRSNGGADEIIIEYGSIPGTVMIPLKSYKTACTSCSNKETLKCEGCLPPLRLRK